ncbi:biotin-dependent carboxyltransferase family protein [Alteromonas halophila]|uniref:Allophanate hydrolase n=1 Tax=Alteromonas halophila TaxID=516698 RepID=A0A918N0B9_9ALTE|nr:biotin-dependent carboxyltransferase family protein [Alteromonas halophila]GGW88919.1 allophanate hydrolase [Alteromonas halophila]
MTSVPATGIEVRQAGFATLLVDSGRQGTQRFGFSESGPMDHDAYWWANWLCGNTPGTTAFEVMGDADFVSHINVQLSVTGPSADVHVNQVPQPSWTTLSVKEGDVISVKADRPGQRSYMAVAAEWAVESVIGSVCTVSREHLGGLTGTGDALQPGDTVAMLPENPRLIRQLNKEFRPDYDLTAPVSVVAGYQHRDFTSATTSLFYNSEYRVSNKISRMGYRLSGAAVACRSRSLRSEGINLGAIQVPPDGQPIVMMRDRQTLGGYPKLGCVTLLDINRFAQAVPGDVVTFRQTDMNTARSAYLLKLEKRARLTGGEA